MKSPRFAIRAARLQKVLKPDALKNTWKDKVRIAMRSQYLCDPIEYFDFHINIDIECKKLSESIMRGEYIPRGSCRVLSEKSKGLCRQIVVPSHRDALVLQCLSDAMYADVKGKAPTGKAFFEPKDHSFNKNKSSEYGTFASWLNFQKEIFKFSQNRNYIVVTDIANYYDSISYVHLRNIISTIDGMEECVLDMLLYVLSDLLWQPDYMPKVEIGLPQIDLDAPRLLAHCFLYELDEFLASQSGGDFTRFMDDIDVGVDNINDAKRVLRGIDLVLQTRQVRLNGGKTKILTRLEAISHFRIWDNVRLDSIQKAIDFARLAGIPLDSIRRNIRKFFISGLVGRRFDDGNGEKILKRLLNLAGLADVKLPLHHLFKVMMLRPASREAVYNYISRSPLTRARVKILSEFVRSGSIVDHVSCVELSNVLVESMVTSRGVIDVHVEEIFNAVKSEEYFGLYSAIWMGSKYKGEEDLINIVKNSRKTWFGDERLGRLVGGLHPIFYNTPSWAEFVDIVSESRNSGAREVYKFHENLRTNTSAFSSMESFLKSENKSKVTGITHSKFLCLVSMLGNAKVNGKRRDALISKNIKVWRDAYYRAIAKRSSGIKKFT